MLRLRLDPRLAAGLRPPLLQGRVDLLLGVVVIKLPQVGDQRRGQRQLLDVVYSDQLSDAEATEMLQRFNAAEPGDRVQELDRGRGQTGDSGTQEVEELPVLGVHDSSFNELHHRVTAILKLRVTPEAERTSVVLHACVVCDPLRPEAQTQNVPRVRTVPDQKRPVRFPLQFHLSILPVHRAPVPTTLLQLSEAGGEAAGVGSPKGAAGDKSGRGVLPVGTQRDRPW